MDENNFAEMLSSRGIRPTANRILIVRTLATAEHAMTLADVESRIMTIDKSGVFRTLTLFRDKHLVYTFEDGSGNVCYELARSKGDGADEDMHVHFFCNNCSRTFCIEMIPVPLVTLPEGYQTQSINYMVKGICPQCKSKLVG